MQYVLRIVLNLISLAINMGLMYFAFKLLRIFRGGIKEKSMGYICAGILITTIGLTLFVLSNILGLSGYIHLIGVLMMTVGGGIVLIGLRKEYKMWTSL